MKEHAESFGAKIIAAKINEIKKNDNLFTVIAGDNEYSAATVLLATGTIHHHLGLANENKYLGHGLSYCATCDAMFFRNKTVAVIGGGNSALTAALHLAEVSPKVYLIVRKSEFRGEPAWIENVKNNDKIEVIFSTNVLEMSGETKLEGIKLDKEFNGSDQLAIDGLFVEIGSSPETEMLDALEIEIDEQNYIKVGADQATNVAGVYAAGDVTNGSNRLHQIITACAEGAVAAGAIFQYLKKIKA